MPKEYRSLGSMPLELVQPEFEKLIEDKILPTRDVVNSSKNLLLDIEGEHKR